MSSFFLSAVNISITASWIVAAVLILRLLLRKAPKWINVLLWGIVAVRLVFPISIESFMSLVPRTQTISPEIISYYTPAPAASEPVVNNVTAPVTGQYAVPEPVAAANPVQTLMTVLTVIWIAGIVLMLIYSLVSYIRVRIKTGTSIRLRDNIYQSENVSSPFVLGIFSPKIYLPFDLKEEDVDYVIAHEKAHISRKDHWWKPLGFMILTFYWFNPVIWVGYIFLCRDIELACDERVIKELSTEKKADYSQALLNCSVTRRMIAVCPLAFGEVGVKERVKSIISYKKPAFWIIVVAVAASVVLAACFLTNPISSKPVEDDTVISETSGKTEKIPDTDISEETVLPETEPVPETEKEPETEDVTTEPEIIPETEASSEDLPVQTVPVVLQEPETEIQTETVAEETEYVYVPDPEGDAAEYERIKEIAFSENDIRYAYVRGFIDGDGLYTYPSFGYSGSVNVSTAYMVEDWAKIFSRYRDTFKIADYSCWEEQDSLVFQFYVYETDGTCMSTGIKRFNITGSYYIGSVYACEYGMKEKSNAFENMLPEDAGIVLRALPIYRNIADGDVSDLSGNMVALDAIFLTNTANRDYTDPLGMSLEEITEAGRKLFGVESFSVTDATGTVLFQGEDGLYYLKGHGGVSGIYYITSVETAGNGYRITIQTYSDLAHFIPSDLYEITIEPGTGDYSWVLGSVRIIERGETRPYRLSA